MKLSLLTGILAVSLSGTMSAHASTVVTFEDVGPDFWVSQGYGGISGWDGFGLAPQPNPFVYDPILGHYLYIGMGQELSFDQAPVVFEGTYFDSWIPNGSGQTSYSLYYQDQLVYSAQIDAHSELTALNWLTSGYDGLVDKISFSNFFAIDNLTYHEGLANKISFSNGLAIASLANSTSPVPVPGAVWLFGSGLAGLLSFAKRRKTV